MTPTAEPVSRDDIETKLRQIQGEVDRTAEAARPIGIAAGAAVVLVLVGVAYLLGRRRGKKRTTVVEIRRV
ncbi:MAG TPA: hypothetical protein VKI64_00390 [Acidimicrobiales bacterium]|nr:hypothetical protein [Acidimicrobiales bacterium]